MSKRTETSREVRLWIGQIIVPAVTTVAAVTLAVPEVRQGIANKISDIKAKHKRRKIKKS